MDELEAYPFPGMTTGLAMLRRNLDRIPNNDALGTRVGDTYKWLNWK
jgi:hypothetical protein